MTAMERIAGWGAVGGRVSVDPSVIAKLEGESEHAISHNLHLFSLHVLQSFVVLVLFPSCSSTPSSSSTGTLKKPSPKRGQAWGESQKTAGKRAQTSMGMHNDDRRGTSPGRRDFDRFRRSRCGRH